MVLAVTAFCVFVERAQRRIPVNYAKRQVGRRMYAGPDHAPAVQAQHVGRDPADLRVEPAAVPGDDRGFVGQHNDTWWGMRCRRSRATLRLRPAAAHRRCTPSLIIFFCFFYTALVFNSRETAENLKKSGAFIPGIRPGQQTGEYIDKVLTRLTVWGALYVTAVCLLPEILMSQGGVPFVFRRHLAADRGRRGHGLLPQLQAHLMSHQYDGLMKKANLQGYGRSQARRSR